MTVSTSPASETARIIEAGVKPRRYGSWYVAEHRIRSMRSYLQTILVTSVGTPLGYMFAFGVGLASLVDANVGGQGVGGVSYLAFVAPALLAAAAVTVAAEECTYPMMMGFKWNPIFYAMNAAPISGKQVTNGMIIAVLARMVPTVAIYFVIMVLFGAVPSGWGFGAILTATLTGLAVGLVIMPYTASIEEDKGQMAMIMRFGILPMFLFSGTFFPLSQLPIYLQWIGWISPLWHGTQLTRVITFGMSEPIWLTAGHVLYLAGLSLVGWKLTQRVIVRRLNK
ncbi:MAG: putative transporter integral rane subunit [Microbacteriaceae bacterium]|nr:putative transporter integral rane subunit [Microbacteriaceae bacterium]